MNAPAISVSCKNTAPSTQKIPRMLGIKETSQLFGLPQHFIRQLVIKGEIISVKAGNRYLVNCDKLIEYLNGENISQTGAENDIHPIPANFR